MTKGRFVHLVTCIFGKCLRIIGGTSLLKGDIVVPRFLFLKTPLEVHKGIIHYFNYGI